MSTTPEYTSGSNFDRLQVQLALNIVSQFSGGREEHCLSDKVGKSYSIVCDQLGTPTEAYNLEGEEVYDRNAPDSDRIPFLFQGHYYNHKTELANRFRYYSPEFRRYISEVPIGGGVWLCMLMLKVAYLR